MVGVSRVKYIIKNDHKASKTHVWNTVNLMFLLMNPMLFICSCSLLHKLNIRGIYVQRRKTWWDKWTF